MSDHDAPQDDGAPDPMDKAYAEAEAVLNDERARAARRARVLAAVAGEPASVAAAPEAANPRPAWGRGGWLAAACVAGLSVLFALQVRPPPAAIPPPPAPAAPTASAASVAAPDRTVASPTPTAREPSEPTKATPRPLDTVGPPAEPSPASRDLAPAAPPAPQPPPPPMTQARAPAAVAAPAPPSAGLEEMVVTSERRASPPARAADTAKPGDPAADGAERLRAAAAAGRTSEIKALLAAGVPVDAPDEDGGTALMKAVQADQPAAAALLRRHGASLDLRNHAGSSARDMAAQKADAKLDRALGLGG